MDSLDASDCDHLGLYGVPGTDGTRAQYGWRKDFAYPDPDDSATPGNESFWLARPPHWPDLPDDEWTHLR